MPNEKVRVPFTATDVLGLTIPHWVKLYRAKKAAREATRQKAKEATAPTTPKAPEPPKERPVSPITQVRVLPEDRQIGSHYESLPSPSSEARRIAQDLKAHGFSGLQAKLPPELSHAQYKSSFSSDTGYEADYSLTRKLDLEEGSPTYKLFQEAVTQYNMRGHADSIGYGNQAMLVTAPIEKDGKPWRAMIYKVYAPREYDSSRRSASVQMWFGAPEEFVTKLLSQLPQRPELMDEVFRTMYPDILSRGITEEQVSYIGAGERIVRYTGVRRVETKGLTVIECDPNKSKYADQPTNIYKYSKTIPY